MLYNLYIKSQKDTRFFGHIFTKIGKGELCDMPKYSDNPATDRQVQAFIDQASKLCEDNVSCPTLPSACGRRDMERALCGLISAGNIDRIAEVTRSFTAPGVKLESGLMSCDEMHQCRYLMVASVTVFCRAAIDGGLPEQMGYALSDSLIQVADTIESPQLTAPFMAATLVAFTEAVRQQKYSLNHPTLRKCHEYISAHLQEPIRVTQLAEYVSRNPSYLSGLFQKELGQSPAAYIRGRKLSASRWNLAFTRESVAAIADTYAFPSASAFCAQFREAYGQTPQQYRKQQQAAQRTAKV